MRVLRKVKISLHYRKKESINIKLIFVYREINFKKNSRQENKL